METELFSRYLKKKGKQDHVIRGLMAQVSRFEGWLQERYQKELDAASGEQILVYLGELEVQKKGLGKKNARGIALYYSALGMRELALKANDYREEAIAGERGGFNLKEIRGINLEHLVTLEKAGIRTTAALLEASRTVGERQALAKRTGIPGERLLELVKLADLSRLPGVKGIRTRLYYDAGVDTLDKLAAWDPGELRAMLVDWVARTGFEGIAALPKEVLSTVETARILPRLIEY